VSFLRYSMSKMSWPWNPGQRSLTYTWTFDLWPWQWVRVTCDVGYLCAKFSLPRPFCSRLRPDLRGRQTSDAHHRLMPPTLGAGHNNFLDSQESLKTNGAEGYTEARHNATDFEDGGSRVALQQVVDERQSAAGDRHRDLHVAARSSRTRRLCVVIDLPRLCTPASK